ncbi:MAG: aldo/keto reductase [Micromonosporaceae bacterium]
MGTPTISIAGYEVSRVGLGTMQLTGPKGMGEPADPATARAVLRQAVDAGTRLIDTSGYYGPEVANRLLAEALYPYPSDLLIATKVGARRTHDGGFTADATPQAIRAAVHDNLRQLRLDVLPLVHARYMPDTTVPFEETIGALDELRIEGLVAHIGVSNVTTGQLDLARSVAPIASVENEYHLGLTSGHDVLQAATSAGIPYLAFRPLANGVLLRPSSPMVSVSAQTSIPAATLALAWILAQSPGVAVIPGTSSPAHLAELLAARELELSGEIRQRLDGLEWS